MKDSSLSNLEGRAEASMLEALVKLEVVKVSILEVVTTLEEDVARGA